MLLQECEPLFAASKAVAENITQNEKRTPDPNTWGCIPGCNFQSTVLKWFKAAKDETIRLERDRDPKRQRGDAAAHAPVAGAQKRASTLKEPPIILLPISDSAVLSMRNGLQFFQSGVFVANADDASDLPAAPKEFDVKCDAALFLFTPHPASAYTSFLFLFPTPLQLQRHHIHVQGHVGLHPDGMAGTRCCCCCHGQHVAGVLLCILLLLSSTQLISRTHPLVT